MMPSRSVLLLITCMTCLGFARSSVGAQASQDAEVLPSVAAAIETKTTPWLSSSPISSVVAQNTAPNPTEETPPTDTVPTLSNPTPSPKQPAASRGVRFRWTFWAIIIGAVLVVVAGGLFYLLQRFDFDDQAEPIDPEPAEDEVAQNVVPEEEYVNADRLTPHSDINPPENHNNGFDNIVSPVVEKPLPEDLKTQSGSESLEVQETTRLPKINIVDELIRDLHSPDPTKRRKAIWELAQRGDSRAMQPLVELMIDADSQQRGLILEALSQIGNRTLKPMNRALALSLQDDNAEVRKNAIRDLTRLYDLVAQVSQLLRHAVEDPDAEVQETARWALSQLSRIRALPGADNSSSSGNSSDKPPQ